MNLDAPRIRYAVDVLGDLFPGSSVSTAANGGDLTFALAPSDRHPRLLVPTSPRDAAATALGAYGGRLTRRAELGYGLAARTLRLTGAAPLRGRMTLNRGRDHSAGIDKHLAEVLGCEVSVAIHLTPDRANRKPILQALAAGERHPVGFIKVGVNPLTSRLVEREAKALEQLAASDLDALTVPAVTGYTSFAGHNVLTLAPLPTWQPGRPPALTDVATASRELASLLPGSCQALAASPYWQDVERRVAQLSSSDRAARLGSCVERTTGLLGSSEVTFTASHGDWTPWNMWLTDGGLLVWDWERFETATPAGIDLLHFRLNDQFVRGSWTREDAGHQLLREAPSLLAKSGAADAPLHTALLYLIHLGLRYEEDGQAEAGAALGQSEAWLLPALEAGLDRLSLTGRTP